MHCNIVISHFFFLFCTTMQFLRGSEEETGCPVLFVRVTSDGLPRGAMVEWHFVAMATPHTPQCRLIIAESAVHILYVHC